jgi:hypothetical protein
MGAVKRRTLVKSLTKPLAAPQKATTISYWLDCLSNSWNSINGSSPWSLDLDTNNQRLYCWSRFCSAFLILDLFFKVNQPRDSRGFHFFFSKKFDPVGTKSNRLLLDNGEIHERPAPSSFKSAIRLLENE